VTAAVAATGDLRRLVRDVFRDHDTVASSRAMLDGREPPAAVLATVTALGLRGVGVDESLGGSGGTAEERAVVAEEAGRALAPGQLVVDLCVAGILADAVRGGPAEALLRSLLAGDIRGSVGFMEPAGADPRQPDAAVTALGDAGAGVTVLIGQDDVYVVTGPWQPPSRTGGASIDPSHPVTRGVPAPLEALRLAGHAGPARAVVRTLLAAEAVGVASAAVDLAVGYAKIRTQFGRLIGQFQAVKHLCADMFVAVELAAAATWDAAREKPDGTDSPEQRELAAAVAATLAPAAALRCTQDAIQVHGGIGFTWEHDAHLYLRRAACLSAFLDTAQAARDVTRLRLAGVRRSRDITLPAEADRWRPELRAFRRTVESLPADQQRRAMVAAGYAQPQWPAPWGRGAGAVEQLVIEQELAGIARPAYDIAEWILPSLIAFGTPDQLERLVRPTVDGALRWCQMFSEPEAGSDAAAVRTRAKRVDGGWLVNGRKIWTSRAQTCDYGFATVRTGSGESKHAGITVMVVDLRAPRVTIRPLRDITGGEMFNEITLDDVFVRDRDVVGAVDDGWRVARATLGNERVTVGTQTDFGGHIDLAALYGPRAADRPDLAARVGVLLARSAGLDAVNLRSVARAVAGGRPGSEGSVAKLVRGELVQHTADLAWELLGRESLVADGDAAILQERFLHARMATIASGTSQIARNLVGERVLGLPRD